LLDQTSVGSTLLTKDTIFVSMGLKRTSLKWPIFETLNQMGSLDWT
jgi:hypothetical protein